MPKNNGPLIAADFIESRSKDPCGTSRNGGSECLWDKLVNVPVLTAACSDCLLVHWQIFGGEVTY